MRKGLFGRAAEVEKRPNFIEFYKISRSLDPSGDASAPRKVPLHHRQRDRDRYSRLLQMRNFMKAVVTGQTEEFENSHTSQRTYLNLARLNCTYVG